MARVKPVDKILCLNSSIIYISLIIKADETFQGSVPKTGESSTHILIGIDDKRSI